MKYYHLNLVFLLYFSILITVKAQEEPQISFEPYTFETQDKQHKIEAELGTLKVTKNRRKKDQTQLQLKFVRFKSTNPNPGNPIVYLAGGPGGSGIATARGSRFDLFMAMREIGDVIAFDQRGTGMSDGPAPYQNYWAYPLDQPLEKAKVNQVIGEFAQKAKAYWEEKGEDLSAYNTNESADDINDLRIALGAEKISLWSISYGSHLALATLRRHEKSLDKIILAGVEGLHQTVKLPGDTQRLLEKIDALIKADKNARKVYPDFLGDLEKLLDKVEKEPVMVSTQHPLSGSPIEVAIGKYELQILLSNTLSGPQSFARLPYMVHQMLKGDFSPISKWAVYTHGGDISAMNTAMDVASGINQERIEQVQSEAEETLLSDAINFPYMAHYQAWTDLDLGYSFRSPVSSDLPVLCISGTLDGRTPPSNAEEILQYLPNGYHLVIEGAGHSDPLFLSSPIIKSVMLDYMKGKAVGDRKIKLDPVKFYVSEQMKQNGPKLEKRSIESFQHLNVSGLANVYLSDEASEFARVEVAGMPIEDLITRVHEGTLEVTTKGNHNGEWIKVTVGASTIQSITVSGASEVHSLQPIKSEKLVVKVDHPGAATLEVAVKQIKLIMNGGDLTISGTAESKNMVDMDKQQIGTLIDKIKVSQGNQK